VRCESCGREIADKAIVCYRCGAPTAIPERRPAAGDASPPRGGPNWPLIASLIFALGVVVLFWRESAPTDYAVLAAAWAAVLASLWFVRRPKPPA
jgi:hypothetical protein